MPFNMMNSILRFYIVVSISLLVRTEPPPHSPIGVYKGPTISHTYSSPTPSAPVYGPPKLQPIIHKHVYVHIPPPDAVEYKPPKKPLTPSPPQKHYKIVFIKAPIPPTTPTPTIPPLQVNEEKTIIYVLVRKLEQGPEIVVPTPASTSPTKPEVYFIRYKTETEQGGYEKSVSPLKPDDYLGPSIPVDVETTDYVSQHKH